MTDANYLEIYCQWLLHCQWTNWNGGISSAKPSNVWFSWCLEAGLSFNIIQLRGASSCNIFYFHHFLLCFMGTEVSLVFSHFCKSVSQFLHSHDTRLGSYRATWSEGSVTSYHTVCYIFFIISEWEDSDFAELQVQSQSEHHLCQQSCRHIFWLARSQCSDPDIFPWRLTKTRSSEIGSNSPSKERCHCIYVLQNFGLITWRGDIHAGGRIVFKWISDTKFVNVWTWLDCLWVGSSGGLHDDSDSVRVPPK